MIFGSYVKFKEVKFFDHISKFLGGIKYEQKNNNGYLFVITVDHKYDNGFLARASQRDGTDS